MAQAYSDSAVNTLQTPAILGQPSNRIVAPTVIARRSLSHLLHETVIPATASKEAQSMFDIDTKFGTTYYKKRPFLSTPAIDHSTFTFTQDNPYDISGLGDDKLTDVYTDFTINKQVSKKITIPVHELFYNIEDLEGRYFTEEVRLLANAYDRIAAETLFTETSGGWYSGEALDFNTTASALRYAQVHAIPITEMGRNWCLTWPESMEAINKEMNQGTYYHTPGDPVFSDSIRTTFRPRLNYWKILTSNQIPYYEVPKLETGDTVQVRGAFQSGDEIPIDVFEDDGTTAVGSYLVAKKGNLVTFSGVGATIPELYDGETMTSRRKRAGHLRTFVVTEDCTTAANGQATLKISPDLNPGQTSANEGQIMLIGGDGNRTVDGSAYQNVTNVPADNATVTFLGQERVASRPATGTDFTAYRQTCFYYGETLWIANIIMPPSGGGSLVEGIQQDAMTGMAMNYRQIDNGLKATTTHAWTTTFGIKVMRPEYGIRVINEKVDI